jgi:hypothetical protein
VDLISFIGLVTIGAALAVPLVYGLATLLGMTHKQFHPILHRKQQNGATTPVMDGQPESTVEEHESTHRQPRRKEW